jgi:hypothetical protein
MRRLATAAWWQETLLGDEEVTRRELPSEIRLDVIAVLAELLLAYFGDETVAATEARDESENHS